METPLARTDVERRPWIQETTQRPRCQDLLGTTLESGGGSQGLYAQALHSEAAMLWVQGGTAILKPKHRGRQLLTQFLPRLVAATQGSSNWHFNIWQLAAQQPGFSTLTWPHTHMHSYKHAQSHTHTCEHAMHAYMQAHTCTCTVTHLSRPCTHTPAYMHTHTGSSSTPGRLTPSLQAFA